ncbi:hypothetical protein HERIO_1941 [Hepatospora eriocheir]|uniref:Uncharacterized protein n=1 Tax=Hepatospora eriocheir TaxID=1081669 RepID=A0A1X0Q8I2_9MICR|nr:hypothetical protein HERIO_1941 [Hepatospora eriocheir]
MKRKALASQANNEHKNKLMKRSLNNQQRQHDDKMMLTGIDGSINNNDRKSETVKKKLKSLLKAITGNPRYNNRRRLNR